MNKALNLLNMTNKATSNDHNQIIDDSALIECVNKLNSLREFSNQSIQEQQTISKINQINAEMHWFSQCSAAL